VIRTAAAIFLISLGAACQFDAVGYGSGGGPVAADASAGPGLDAGRPSNDGAPMSGDGRPPPIEPDAAAALDAAARPDASAAGAADAQGLLPYGADCQFNGECTTQLCANVRGNPVCTLVCRGDEDCPGTDTCSGNRCDPHGGS
jgi:hypothetical protein